MKWQIWEKSIGNWQSVCLSHGCCFTLPFVKASVGQVQSLEGRSLYFLNLTGIDDIISRQSGLCDSYPSVLLVISSDWQSFNPRRSWRWIALLLPPGLVNLAQIWGECLSAFDSKFNPFHLYFLLFRWQMIKVWVNALAQAFMSMGIAYGCLMAFASYNRFHNPLIRDALCLSLLNSLTSLIAGIIVFAALGHTALVQGLPIDQAATDGNDLWFSVDNDNIFSAESRSNFRELNWDPLNCNRSPCNIYSHFGISSGLSLSLVMYSTVVSQMPFPQFWSVFLFVMFIFIGLDTQVI